MSRYEQLAVKVKAHFTMQNRMACAFTGAPALRQLPGEIGGEGF